MEPNVPWRSPESRSEPSPYQLQSESLTDFSKMGARKKAAKAKKAARQARKLGAKRKDAQQQQSLAEEVYCSQSLNRSQPPRAARSATLAKLGACNEERADSTTEDLGNTETSTQDLDRRRESFVGNALLGALGDIEGSGTAGPLPPSGAFLGHNHQAFWANAANPYHQNNVAAAYQQGAHPAAQNPYYGGPPGGGVYAQPEQRYPQPQQDAQPRNYAQPQQDAQPRNYAQPPQYAQPKGPSYYTRYIHGHIHAKVPHTPVTHMNIPYNGQSWRVNKYDRSQTRGISTQAGLASDEDIISSASDESDSGAVEDGADGDTTPAEGKTLTESTRKSRGKAKKEIKKAEKAAGQADLSKTLKKKKATANMIRHVPTDAPTGPKSNNNPKSALPVPEPTQEYIQQACQEPEIAATPQRLLIIIDLNGALIHRPKRNEPTKFVGRPFVKPFLDYLLNNYTVMVWSSARPENVDRMCSQLFTFQQRLKLKAEWGRDKLGLNFAQYNDKVQVYKQLDKVWKFAAVGNWHPERVDGQLFGQHNTLLIDDSVAKASSEPFNLVQVTEFTGQREQLCKDVLSQVVGYLEQAKMQKDVSRFVKRTPFVEDGGWTHAWPLPAIANADETGTDAASAVPWRSQTAYVLPLPGESKLATNLRRKRNLTLFLRDKEKQYRDRITVSVREAWSAKLRGHGDRRPAEAQFEDLNEKLSEYADEILEEKVQEEVEMRAWAVFNQDVGPGLVDKQKIQRLLKAGREAEVRNVGFLTEVEETMEVNPGDPVGQMLERQLSLEMDRDVKVHQLKAMKANANESLRRTDSTAAARTFGDEGVRLGPAATSSGKATTGEEHDSSKNYPHT